VTRSSAADRLVLEYIRRALHSQRAAAHRAALRHPEGMREISRGL